MRIQATIAVARPLALTTKFPRTTGEEATI